MKEKTHDIDSLVEQILAEGKSKPSPPPKSKIDEPSKETHSLSPQKFAPKPKKKLELVSFVGEINISKELIVKILFFKGKFNIFSCYFKRIGEI